MADRIPVIPEIPHNIPDFQLQILDSIKEAIEVLTGQRGEGNLRVVTKGEITVNPVTEGAYVVQARNASVAASGQRVPLAGEFAKLTDDVQAIANRLEQLQRLVNVLIQQLKETPR